jgi:hypothetical protein
MWVSGGGYAVGSGIRVNFFFSQGRIVAYAVTVKGLRLSWSG